MSSHRSDRLRRPTTLPTWATVRTIVLAVALTGLVVGSLLALRPAPPGVPVLVARHDIATGQAVSAGDLARVLVPSAARPVDALSADAAPPTTWESAPLVEGTVLTESNVAGSPASRALGPGQAQVILSVGADQVQGLSPGDLVDVWAIPRTCEDTTCAASLLAPAVRIASIPVSEESTWTTSEAARVGVILRAVDTELVLGHAGSGSLSLVLRAPDNDAASTHSTGAPP